MPPDLSFFQSRSGSQGSFKEVFNDQFARAFGAAQDAGDKQLAFESAEQKQKDTTDLLNLLAEEPTDEKEEEILNLLTLLQSPQFANQIKQNAERADKKQLDESVALTDDMFKISSGLLEEKNPGKRLTLLRGIIAERQRTGLPVNNLTSLLEKTLDAQGAVLRQMQVTTEKTGEFFKRRKAKLEFDNELANQDKFVPLLNSNGEVVGQMNLKTSEVKKSPLAVGSSVNEKGTFTKGVSTRIRKPDQSLALVTPVTDSRTGETFNAITDLPKGSSIVSTQFGETGREESARKVGQAGGEKREELISTQEEGGAAAAATKRGAGAEKRVQARIDNGLDRAKAIPIISRSLELMELVNTGGFARAKLRAKQVLGIESGDEAELSSNLGKAVLSQLRETFGAQFTENEGALLARIEAGFGKSTAGNIRLLNQAMKILEDAAQRGIKAAVEAEDFATAAEIKEFIGFSLTPGNNVKPPMEEKNSVFTGSKTPEGLNIFKRPDGSTFAFQP